MIKVLYTRFKVVTYNNWPIPEFKLQVTAEEFWKAFKIERFEAYSSSLFGFCEDYDMAGKQIYGNEKYAKPENKWKKKLSVAELEKYRPENDFNADKATFFTLFYRIIPCQWKQ